MALHRLSICSYPLVGFEEHHSEPGPSSSTASSTFSIFLVGDYSFRELGSSPIIEVTSAPGLGGGRISSTRYYEGVD